MKMVRSEYKACRQDGKCPRIKGHQEMSSGHCIIRRGYEGCMVVKEKKGRQEVKCVDGRV